jgi:hypothetical protein
MGTRVLNKLELSQVIGAAIPRCRVSIVLLAFSGIGSRSLGSSEGTEGLQLSDFLESDITSSGLRFDEYPAIFTIRTILHKGRAHGYACICEEGLIYINEYLGQRMQEGEVLYPSSPLIRGSCRRRPSTLMQNLFLPTIQIENEIHRAFISTGFLWKPHILRNYFESNLGLARKNKQITDQELKFLLGHSTRIRESSSHMDRFTPSLLHRIRQAYNAGKPYLSTVTDPITNRSHYNESNGWVYV